MVDRLTIDILNFISDKCS